jgi:ABC-type uncharacterized transport system involved in gliding motility auxiliary subunit
VRPPRPASASGETPASPPPATVAAAAPALVESATPATVVVVTDSDWLLDDFSVRRYAFLGMQAVEPLNDNLAFAANVVDFLGGSQDLISIRGKGTSQRPFTVFRQMELAAQEKYQSELDELEKRLSGVQEELNKTRSSDADGRRLIVTPEVEQKLTEYREQEAKLRSERRAIRRALREGIESLQNTLTFANILAVPATVILLGIAFTVRRHSRQKNP